MTNSFFGQFVTFVFWPVIEMITAITSVLTLNVNFKSKWLHGVGCYSHCGLVIALSLIM